MSEDMLWPHSVRDDVRDAQKLIDFIQQEILTLEFVQGIDPDIEPELARGIRTYTATVRQIEEAIARMKKDV